MAPTAEEIRQRLVDFARGWSLYDGSERAEAQTFLNELFWCYGKDRRDVARFEEPQEGRFLDLIWERVCLIEMKRPSVAKRLATHREQAFDYWRNSARPDRNVPAPRFVVLCAFQRFEVWEPGSYPNEPRIEFELRDLPDQADALAFLAGRDPVFTGTQAAVTQEAVRLLTDLFHAVRDRGAAGPDELREFFFQSVWSMFAEDLGQLPSHLFTRLVDDLIDDPRRSSADQLGQLFGWMNDAEERPPAGFFVETPYVNGGLFEHPAHIHLDVDELRVLRLVCGYDWRRVEPTIFGSLMQGVLGREAQWELGAHYTHEADIQKIVKPSIVDPWRERIDNAENVAETEKLQQELLNYVVLDPACGSGNFLYTAYRELRRLEDRLRRKQIELRRRKGMPHVDQAALAAFFPLTNIRGIEIDATAVAIARLTLWMGHKLSVDELSLTEATLPLGDLSGVAVGDALRREWPHSSVIIGNPPFHGDRHLRGLLGDPYVDWLKSAFGIGIKDYCAYWFRKAHDHLEPGQRAGLVGTNSVTQNRARPVTLDHIIDHDGAITNAISTQDWPGEANVDVSIINWVKTDAQAPPTPAVLDGDELDEPIAGSLRPWSIAVERSQPLPQNKGFAFFGPIPGASGFVLTPAEAKQLLAGKPDSWSEIVRPYLIGDDLTKDPRQEPSRYIIDFGHRSLEEAADFPEALDIVRERVKPQRDKVRRDTYRRNWWRFSEPLREMREAIAGFDRYIASPAQAKRIQFSFVDAHICPSNLVTIFAFRDDYAMGVLSSFAHDNWLRAGWSTLEDRLRYTPSTVFATFPWPKPTPEQREAIAVATRELLDLRQTLCLEHNTGLTNLYNAMEEGGFAGLASCHRTLDRHVAAAYGWSIADVDDSDEVLRRLKSQNLEVDSGKAQYAGPG
jgi:hypothetical protein